jgi:hypothetical protein
LALRVDHDGEVSHGKQLLVMSGGEAGLIRVPVPEDSRTSQGESVRGDGLTTLLSAMDGRFGLPSPAAAITLNAIPIDWQTAKGLIGDELSRS